MPWYEWVFSGIGVFGLGLLVTWWKKSKKQNKSSIEAHGGKVSDSPVATGTGHKQNVNETNIYIGGSPSLPSVEVKAPQISAEDEEPKPNIAYSGVETIGIVEEDNGFFVPREHSFPAVLVKFSNDAVRGAQTKGALVKATIVYRKTGDEILRVKGAWLERASGEMYFEVDSSHKLILCFVFNDELCTLDKFSRIAHGRTWWQTTLKKLSGVEHFNAVVRLTSTSSGFCYFEGEFEVQKSPLTFSLLKQK
jgi:hypothetical protein